MDLLACSQCEHRFYVPGVAASDGRLCPECGGGLALTEHGLGSIPLDAHWLEPRGSPAPAVTVVELRPKRERGGKSGRRIVRGLAGYFPVKANGRSVEVSVNRGEAADAALRVAAVLDGVDSGWEQHFYLPTSDPQEPSDELRPPPARTRGHLHLVSSGYGNDSRQGWA
jgi:hypothetical protein